MWSMYDHTHTSLHYKAKMGLSPTFKMSKQAINMIIYDANKVKSIDFKNDFRDSTFLHVGI